MNIKSEPIYSIPKVVGRHKPEKRLSMQVARYLSRNYPEAIFQYDIASDLPMEAYKAKRLRMEYMHTKGHPDLNISEPRGGWAGMFIELKVRAKVTEEQSEKLTRLKAKGYYVIVGRPHDVFQHIDAYMSLSPTYQSYIE
jgi:hypothetical protein